VLQATSQKVEELRNFLKGKLPEHMIPSAFVFLGSLPLTPNGKVDRKALPVPDQTRPELEGAFVAPRTALEKRLARIWGEVLKLEKVGIHDNFFELGGQSLLATQVISRIRTAFGAEVPLRAMFEASIRMFRHEARGNTRNVIVPVVPNVPSLRPVPVV